MRHFFLANISPAQGQNVINQYFLVRTSHCFLVMQAKIRRGVVSGSHIFRAFVKFHVQNSRFNHVEYSLKNGARTCNTMKNGFFLGQPIFCCRKKSPTVIVDYFTF
jgi:hypothetical protein